MQRAIAAMKRGAEGWGSVYTPHIYFLSLFVFLLLLRIYYIVNVLYFICYSRSFYLGVFGFLISAAFAAVAVTAAAATAAAAAAAAAASA